MEETVKTKKKRRLPGWAKTLITVAATLAAAAGIFCLVMGRSGLSLVESWVLARFAFVDTQADLNKAADQALYGLVNGLGDRWSYYLEPESYRQVTENRANNYVGVGVTVSMGEGGFLVQGVTQGGPAEKAGILAGETIVAADGVSLAGESLEKGTELITGPQGTEVVLTIRAADGTLRDVTCVRKRLQNPSAAGQMLEDMVGYVRLSNFYTGAADSFRSVVDQLVAEGAESLVIDLRNDPGGYIAELEEILDYLLPEGPVLTQKPRVWFGMTTKSDAACIDLPMAVLVNTETYSAAELLAAQLRETLNAPIVGEITSGKGYSQITFALPNGGGLGLSIATYSTGSGHSLIGEGIIPDVEISLDGSGTDVQLEAALELLKTE